MNFFCRLFGHTWLPETIAPSVRWNTTKEGHTLASTIGEEAVRHLEVCRRCGEKREAPGRRHDKDRPMDAMGDAAGNEAGAVEAATE